MKVIFYILYILMPLPPLLLFGDNLGPIESWSSYSWGPALGICAFTYITGQLILAARPFNIDKWLGTQRLVSFHTLMAIVGIAIAIVHFIIQYFVNDSGLGPQTLFGLCSLILLFLTAIFTLLFQSNTFVASWKWIKKLREKATATWKWTYKGLRAVHNIMNIALAGIIVHIVLAQTLTQATAAFIWLLSWVGLGIILYVMYRARNRKGIGARAKKTQE